MRLNSGAVLKRNDKAVVAAALSEATTLTQHPAVHIANAAFDQTREMLIEFGMTPSSRSRVSKAPTGEADQYAAFVKKARK